MENVEGQLARFYEKWRRIDILYEEYAKSMGLSDTSMKVLYYIYKDEDCTATQQNLCERTSFPKQTIHSVIKIFQKQGYIDLTEDPSDRRARLIRLTEQGRAFCEAAFQRLEKAERRAMELLPAYKREELIGLLGEYVDSFASALHET